MNLTRFALDERGSAYAWLVFFVLLWTYALVWYLFGAPFFNAAIETGQANNFTNLTGGQAFYDAYSALYPLMPFLIFIFTAIGLLKYASDIRKRW